MALPVNGSTHLIPAYYSFYRPRKDERLSWPSWLTYSGWLTYINGHPSAAGRAQDRESSPARDRRSTTVPRHQLFAICLLIYTYMYKNNRAHNTQLKKLAKMKWSCWVYMNLQYAYSYILNRITSFSQVFWVEYYVPCCFYTQDWLDCQQIRSGLASYTMSKALE